MNMKLYLIAKNDFIKKVETITSIVDKKNTMVFTGLTKNNKTITISYSDV